MVKRHPFSRWTQTQGINNGTAATTKGGKSSLALSGLPFDHLHPPQFIQQRGFGPFFPHGLGHMLGIQVHDVSGKQQNMSGAMFDPNKEFPALRNYRTVEVGNVFTVEPGIYFIPTLVENFKNDNPNVKLDYDLIDELVGLGGIRIEDNVYISENGTVNLTRKYLP